MAVSIFPVSCGVARIFPNSAQPLGGFGLLGVNDDSLTRWVGCWWRWRKGRRLISYRGEAGK